MDVDMVPFHASLFARAPVYDLVFSCLSPRTLFRVALTCRAAYEAVSAFNSRAFNINRHFSRYFTNPITFRSLQARTNTLVSGSDALQFLDRSFYPDADLDIYTHPGHSLEVAKFLVETEGYHFSPRENQRQTWEEDIGDNFDGTQRRVTVRQGDHVYPMRMIRGVWTFEKTGLKEERLKVQIIEGETSPLEVILGFHSTCVMNFITSDAAYSLYPIATLEDRSSLAMVSGQRSFDVIQKYVHRGWRIYFAPTPSVTGRPMRPPFLLDRVRWVGDRYTWVIPLDQTGVQKRPPLSPTSAPLTFDPVICNGWKLRYKDHNGAGFDTHYYPILSTLFRYNYGIPDEKSAFGIREWATVQGRTSHMAVHKEDWVWFDADIPSFLHKK